MHLTIWISFILAIFVLMYVGRKSIWAALFIAALIIGIFNLSAGEIYEQVIRTVTDVSVLMLATAVGLIPLIGGTLEETGLTEDLVTNLRISRKWFVSLSPALLGALPMPGGALLSAPILNKGSKGISSEVKAVLNVWFRHLPLLVYPLGALLVATKMAKLDLYTEILYVLPWALITLLVGFFFFLRKIKGRIESEGEIDYSTIAKPIAGILLAPAIHLTLTSIFPDIRPEFPLLMGVISSLLLVNYFGKTGGRKFLKIVKEMSPWKFFLIIIGMFTFLNIFKSSQTSEVIASIVFSKTFFIVGLSAFLGFVTGRVKIPVSILLPIYYAKFNKAAMAPLTFSIMYVAIFMGYLLSPIHPCVSVSVEYFGTTLKDYFKKITPPVLILIGLLTLFSVLFL